jgi:hypothetical protein
MKTFRSTLIWFAVFIATFATVAAVAQKTVVCIEGTNCAHVYIAGDRSLTLLTDDMAVTVRIGQLENPSHYTVAVVEVTNNGKQPFDVLPTAFTLEQMQPKVKLLRYVTPEKVEKRINRWTPWRNYFLANEAASATKVVSTTNSTTTGTTSGTTSGSTTGSVTNYGPDGVTNGSYSGSVDAHSTADTTSHTNSTTTVPDLQRRADIEAEIAANREAAANVAQAVKSATLVATTVVPGARVQGIVWLEQSTKMKTGILEVPINGIVYQFNFAW